MKLIFERSVPGRACTLLPECDVPVSFLPEHMKREEALQLPELSEIDLSRHYTELAKQVFGVNDGFYPLGSCTMKYNPAVNEEMAALPGFAGVHPLQEPHTVQGCLEVLATAEKLLCKVTGMDAMTFQPAAGAHGEYTGMLIIKAYHKARGDLGRTKVIVPDSAHGTNPATAAMCGFQVVNVPSGSDGCVDLDALRAAVGPDTAGLMLTNPNTLGLFDKNILEITRIIHDAGGLNYYDGANLNAVMGMARPGDMGFDVVHLNLHKTFSTPHGGGGPGSGAVGVKAFLARHLPKFHAAEGPEGFCFEKPEATIGSVKEFYGNFLVVVRALCYMLVLGEAGLRDASQTAVLNANYMRVRLAPYCPMASQDICMHEFVMTLADLKRETGVSAKDVAKAMLDYGMHAPTMYFPLIVEEALMVEPTETESKETLDWACDCIIEILKRAKEDPAAVQAAPVSTPIGRPDEVTAARSPKLRCVFGG
ncbi:putative glycine dehydrogenase (decarboxylating) subunit 2 [uncultured Eubacteriales bacterium]|uniref:glycine dehydrogenase (aminomethyl-transferring) n=1 Tax=uncultured Eubacteriales bacterium TaxID=172733 RepID=A0A212JRF0_9FIRM|nr:putative glycine dehydrogenase (decarboxylating) subunit 2 [uncultured Eubacteriales bacterium]